MTLFLELVGVAVLIALNAFFVAGEYGLVTVRRTRELIEHHAQRLVITAGALSSEPRTGYEISHRVFGDALGPTQRRFAVAETLSHLERLVREGTAARTEADGTVTYTTFGDSRAERAESPVSV